MGATAWSYLTGYNDPRMNKYYTKGTYNKVSGYGCIAPGNTLGKAEGDNTAIRFLPK
ncbi:SusD/RagB family nutrient-binding outer membrane lipoprotein [Bacteroides sp. BFG-637]|uniref:SusD/RagB family nutrient-binding outer membrane lipoprotein n=1 Tax=Bacteroides sp. BFG-637 TaxID=2972764 RepID=UPI00286C59D2|nr:SusD/RagB family nutrient-binding outer membrane lipoprotein [Bacteroides sp. BFG-637]